MIAQDGKYMAPYELYKEPTEAVKLPFQSQPEVAELRPTAGIIAGATGPEVPSLPASA